MDTVPHEPAQRTFTRQLIDWERVESRHHRYPAIRRTFPLDAMKKRRDSPPYYCHYMSWRLGVWNTESRFYRLEELLLRAEEIPNWEQEKRSFVNSGDFADFWAVVWQLQIAEHLCFVGKDVRWVKTGNNKPGPDLSVIIGDHRWYVECYVPRKSFGVLRFLDDVFWNLDPNIRTSYDHCLPFELPSNSDRAVFLNKILTPFLDPRHLARAKEEAKTEYPVLLYRDANSSLHIYVEGDGDYMPGIVPNQTGDPKYYVECVLREAVNAKTQSNGLATHHPNLVAVNYLLGDDFQIACTHLDRIQSQALPRIGPNIDALAVASVGIDERLTRQTLYVVKGTDHAMASSLERIAGER